MKYDIDIMGRGFYTIEARTTRGQEFMSQVEGWDGNAAYSDDTRLTQDIADGALYAGLNVRANGKQYGADNA
jgi:hypothetical protein